MIKEQRANERAIKIGQYVHNLPPRHGPTDNHSYTFGGVTRLANSAQKNPGTSAAVKDQFGLLTEVNRQQYVGKSTALNPRVSSARPQSAQRYQKAKAYYPKEYFRRVGYQQSEASVVSSKSRTDALGQRVRQRFNEEIDFKDTQ